MRINNTQLKDFIKDGNLVPADKLEEAFQNAEEQKKFLGDVLLDQKLVEESKLRELYAYILGVPFVDLRKEIIPADILQIVPEPIARRYKVVAFERKENAIKVAMLNPEDIQTIDFIRKKTGLKIITCLTSEESIDTILKQYEKSLKAEFGDIIDANAEKIGEGEEADLEKMARGLPIIRIVDTLIKHAILQNASDIHIEPEEGDVKVRYRIDGILHDAMSLPKAVKDGIVARIKVLSNLKLDEHRVPQDGRFKIEQDDKKTSFRVSILPVFDGEKVVMRLLDESSKGLTLEKMGLYGRGLEIVHRNIKRPNGMILSTGPTGSGKTTTLYTVMDILNTAEVNICTIEDPIEYRMPRINQTQIHPKVGLTFAAGLRALLRQDPNIIMVGEIRDNETVEMAIHSAMTGHLVLSTLHTNSAAGALPRLLDMGAEPFLVASTVNTVIAQRLVRKLCSDCKQEYKTTAEKLEKMGVNVDFIKTLELVGNTKEAGGAFAGGEITLYRPVGCEQCGKEGYHGRVGIFEVLEVDEDIKKLISQKSSTEEIEKTAKEHGMATMLEDGILKAIQGMTSIEEVLRVTRE